MQKDGVGVIFATTFDTVEFGLTLRHQLGCVIDFNCVNNPFLNHLRVIGELAITTTTAIVSRFLKAR